MKKSEMPRLEGVRVSKVTYTAPRKEEDDPKVTVSLEISGDPASSAMELIRFAQAGSCTWLVEIQRDMVPLAPKGDEAPRVLEQAPVGLTAEEQEVFDKQYVKPAEAIWEERQDRCLACLGKHIFSGSTYVEHVVDIKSGELAPCTGVEGATATMEPSEPRNEPTLKTDLVTLRGCKINSRARVVHFRPYTIHIERTLCGEKLDQLKTLDVVETATCESCLGAAPKSWVLATGTIGSPTTVQAALEQSVDQAEQDTAEDHATPAPVA